MSAVVEPFRGTLVLGGGPAGAGVAHWLARTGHPVQLWESETYPQHKACAGILGPVAQAALVDLGVDLDRLGASVAEKLRLVSAGRTWTAALGFRARGLSRHQFDAALLEQAVAAGARVMRGVTARAVEEDGSVRAMHGGLRPAVLVVATGGAPVAGVADPPPSDGRTAFYLLYRLLPAERAALSGHIERLMFDGGWATLHMVERDAASLLVVVEANRLAAFGGEFPRLLQAICSELPHLARRLEGAVRLMDQPCVRTGLPQGFVCRPHPDGTGPIWCVGEWAAAMPPAICDGISLALCSARMAARSILIGETPPAFRRHLRREVGGVIGRNVLLARWGRTAASGHDLALHLASIPGLMPLVLRNMLLKAG